MLLESTLKIKPFLFAHAFLTTSPNMMTSSNGNIFCLTGHLCGEFTGHRWIPRTQTSDAELSCFFFICARINDWVNSCEVGDLRRHRAPYDVTVMNAVSTLPINWTILDADVYRYILLDINMYVYKYILPQLIIWNMLSLIRECYSRWPTIFHN